ncbi:copper-exporting ATPase [Actinobaculum sp. oral taxon 183 str. F0552]|uniref:heavy metal translocating P-type ATPase n=1 Tax=Actinobaculum sp. oral taxon 183 TaxID=712888 RepID=UPI00039860AF|nr:heavy metal translocating P-type ATPase [Actinobaculum sp. oral taxon 183]ERH19065.1 copper-exporting ATPase [Actinobaculum sp. oral taxon 183 str. F0552]
MVDDPLEATGRAPGSGGAAPALPLTSRQDASLQTDGSAAPAVEVELAISGMTCASCVARVEKKLGKLPGVTAVVNLATEKARVELSPQAEDVEDSILVGTVVKAGYGATVLRRIRVGADGQREASAGVDAAEAEAAAARASSARVADLRRRFFVSLALSAPIVAVSMTPAWQFSGWQWFLGALSVPVALWCAWPFHRAAWRAGRHGSTTMDTLVSLGIVASMGWSLWALLVGGAGEFGYTMHMTGIHGLGHAGRPHLYFETAAMIVTFLLLGRWLEARSRRSAGDALRSLLSLGAQEATRVRRADGTAVEEVVEAGSIEVGDEFLVRPGEKVATDGVVLDGASAVDASLLTGESVPVDVSAGASVTGATVNTYGVLTVRATRVGEETTLAQMGRLLTEAQTGKAPVQRIADRISAVFVPAVIAIAAATFAVRLALGNPLEMALASAITVLVVACPCALGLATPTALLVGSGRASKLGALIKGPEILESAHAADTIIFDKTGTITTGAMGVADVRLLDGDMDELVALAAGIERGSEHPIARAIVDYARERSIAPTPVVDAAAAAGHGISGRVDGRVVHAGSLTWLESLGVRCRDESADAADMAAPEGADGSHGLAATAAAAPSEAGASLVGVSLDGRLLGIFAVRDTLRTETPEAVAELKDLGLRPILVTGDNEATARAIAAQAGVDDVRAGVLPEGKLAVVEGLHAEGRTVAMVGDGVNDAAALAGADLSIAMGSGTDVAKAASDVTIVNSDVRTIGAALRISARTLRIIKENLVWAFGYNVIAIPLAVFGVIVPGLAAAAMASSSVIVVGNSLRLRKA